MNTNDVKYYFKDTDGQTNGPFSKQQIKDKHLHPITKIWYRGLDDWITYSSVFSNESEFSKNTKNAVIWSLLILFLCIAIYFIYNNTTLIRLRNNSYDLCDAEMYVNKYYRDLKFFGISRAKPYNITIKLAPMQYFEDTKDFHGICYGIYNNKIIEVYINEDSWKNFNRAQKYFLMYHELSHDILNVDDLTDSPENYNKLMSPTICIDDKINMDYFIEISHKFFINYSKIHP